MKKATVIINPTLGGEKADHKDKLVYIAKNTLSTKLPEKGNRCNISIEDFVSSMMGGCVLVEMETDIEVILYC